MSEPKLIISVKVDLIQGNYGQLRIDAHVVGSKVRQSVTSKEYHPEEFKSYFDIIWEDIGLEIEKFYKKESKDES